ncbi:MAG: tetratricopeptide repeat protein [Xanthomonadales bacterium]|nr:tetratricopeptide repeat protein [Xanthomonadales bacterium]
MSAGGGYSAREIAEFLQWPVSRVYSFARSGVVEPTRRARRLRFGFRDLVVLRAAKSLIDQRLSPQRVRRALEHLRQALPDGSPLSTARLEAAGNRIALRQDGQLWEIETGQGTLDFDQSQASLTPEPTPARTDGYDADDWFDAGVDLEEQDLDAAIHAYGRALELDEGHADALVNLGRIRQQQGDAAGAVGLYEQAREADPEHAIARFNLGTAWEELGEIEQAIEAYRSAAPNLTDARYNLARLYERTGRRALAIQELRTLLRQDRLLS